MIFQHSWQAILEGRKTQTRRIVKTGQRLEELFYDWYQMYVFADETNKRCVYGTYHNVLYPKTYAVQPGRGKKSVARIEILSIRREDVRTISDEDVKAEGFSCATEFLKMWVAMHDKQSLYTVTQFLEHGGDIDMVNGVPSPGFRVLVASPDKDRYYYNVRDYLIARRPAERYDAWAIEFEVVK